MKDKPKVGRPRINPIELPRFGSVVQMASACGIPIAILHNATKSGCRFKDVHGRCDLVQFLEWFFSQNPDEDNVDWANRAKRAGALIKEVELSLAHDQVVDYKTCTGFIRNLIAVMFFGELDRLENEFPATLKGKDEIAISLEVKSQIALMKKNIVRQLEIWEAKKGKV